jgi:hypothetical protein
VNASDRNLAILISVTALGAIGIYFAARNSVFFPQHGDAPLDSAAAIDSTLHGANWNGALPIATSPDQAPLPTALPSSSSSPFGSTNPPPLSAIPAPIVALPMDESVSEKQRARDLQMLNDQVTVLEQQAVLAESKGDTVGAAAIRIREARVRGRIASLQDSGAP